MGRHLRSRTTAFVLLVAIVLCAPWVAQANPIAKQNVVVYYVGNKADEDIWSFSKDSEKPIFEDGVLDPRWRPRSDADSDTTASVKRFRHDQYTDRISFNVDYGINRTRDVRNPEASASNASVAKPKIDDFLLEDDKNWGSFSVVYDCAHHTDSNATSMTNVTVYIPTSDNNGVQLQFEKICGGGKYHPYLDFGYFSDGKEEKRAFAPTTDGPVFEASPQHLSTRLYLHLRSPSGSQEFFHINAKSSNPSVASVAVRGPVFGGVLRSGGTSVIHVVYECQKAGSSLISLEIPIPPFAPLQTSWTKKCDQRGKGHVYVGSNSSDIREADIVMDGKSLPGWVPDWNKMKNPDNKPDKLTVMSEDRHVVEFFVMNEGLPIELGSTALTLSKPDILAVLPVSGTNLRFATAPDIPVLSPAGAHLGAKGKVRLRMELICKKKGSSLVIVSIPTQAHAGIEFGFRKLCRAPRVHTHSGFLRTANSLMGAFILTFVLLMAAICSKRSAAHDYQKV